MEKNTIKVLIADDSMLMRFLIKDLLAKDSSLEIVGVAGNGNDAFLMTRALKPDVVLMDLNMGEYDGLLGIGLIMEHCPTPIIILSAVGNEDMAAVMEGLTLGAIDYLNKPAKNHVNMEEISDLLVEKIKAVASTSPSNIAKTVSKNIHSHSFDGSLHYEIIVIAASTGGTAAIEQIITHLPENLPIPLVIVQHIPQNFVKPFAERLDKISPIRICVPQAKDRLEPSKIYLVQTDKNTLLEMDEDGAFFDFTNQQFTAYNFPSADAIFMSAAQIYGKKTIGVVLTGMGRDGAWGAKLIKEKGGYTIAQSADSCVVYGMPKAAIEDNAISKIVKLKDIAGFLVSCL